MPVPKSVRKANAERLDDPVKPEFHVQPIQRPAARGLATIGLRTISANFARASS
jgi:hypothetical protein